MHEWLDGWDGWMTDWMTDWMNGICAGWSVIRGDTESLWPDQQTTLHDWSSSTTRPHVSHCIHPLAALCAYCCMLHWLAVFYCLLSTNVYCLVMSTVYCLLMSTVRMSSRLLLTQHSVTLHHACFAWMRSLCVSMIDSGYGSRASLIRWTSVQWMQ